LISIEYPRISPLTFQHIPSEDDHLIQLELTNINAAKPDLASYKGFRHFVATECRRIGLYGYIWREPTTRAKILASGSGAQIKALLTFCEELRAEHYIEAFFSESPVEQHVLMKGFSILPSKRKFVQTGVYSDDEYDSQALSSPRNGEARCRSGSAGSDTFYPASPVYLVPHDIKKAPAFFESHSKGPGAAHAENSHMHDYSASGCNEHQPTEERQREKDKALKHVNQHLEELKQHTASSANH
jgi:acylphosphatase